MKITIITTNGIAEAFYGWPERLQARALVQRGHTVNAYTYLGKQDWNNKPHESIDGVKVTRMRRKDWLSLDMAKAFWQDPKPDVVHFHHLSNQLAFQALLNCKLRGIPTVLTPHGPFHDPYLVADRDRPFEAEPFYDQIIRTPSQLAKSLRHQFKPKRAVKNYLTHSPLALVDRVVVLSCHEREVMLKLGVPDHKITLIPNAIDPNWLDGIAPAPKPVGELRVLYLGQLKYRKGFDLLARAIPLVAAQVPQARFIFAGHSPIQQDDLQKLLDAGNVSHLVDFPGHVSEEQKAALFLSSDLFVLPTRYEGFGIPPIEAMSAGCPVISTNIPVINEIIQPEQNGLLFEYNNYQDLADTIIRALQDASLRQKLAQNGRQTVQQYYTPIIIDQLEQLYHHLLNDDN